MMLDILTKDVEEMEELDEVELNASICRQDFYEFVQEFWELVVPEKPIWNWHIHYICNVLQEAAERVFLGEPKKHDIIFNQPPGTSKSTIISIMFPAWVWTRMPSARCLCVSYAYDLAMDLSRKCRELIKSAKYQEHFPDVLISPEQDSKGYFTNTRGGMRMAAGVDGGVTGFHAHFIITDDPINPKQALSEITLKTANDFMKETLPSRKVDKMVSVMILVMQRLHDDDPTAQRLAIGKEVPVFHVCLPAEDAVEVHPPHLRSKYQQGLLDPIRLNLMILQQEMKNLGEYGYSGQYGQNPAPRGGGMFHVDKIEIMPFPPKRFKKLVRYWDKAASVDPRACRTCGVLLGLDMEGYIWILDVVRGRWHSHIREQKIVDTARLDGTVTQIWIEQEPGSGGKVDAEATIRRLHGFTARLDKVGKSSGDKVARAEPFSVQVNSGNVFAVKAPWNKECFDEMRLFPVCRYMDFVDASSGSFNRISLPNIVVGGCRYGPREEGTVRASNGGNRLRSLIQQLRDS